MALRRHSMATSRRIQSQRRLWIRVSDNEQSDGKEIYRKKFFWNQRMLPKTKTRKRRKKVLVESDWRTYYGSNNHLNEDVEKQGAEMFHREILHMCKTKGECSYLEAKEQFDREVLLTDDYYNGIIQIRLGGNAVKNIK